MNRENQKEIDNAILAIIGKEQIAEQETPEVSQETLAPQQERVFEYHDQVVLTIGRLKQLLHAVDGKIDTRYLDAFIDRNIGE